MKKTFIFLMAIITMVALASCDNGPVEDLKEIKIYGNFDTFDPNKDYVFDLIEELTGIKPIYDFLPQNGEEANTKLFLDIASRAQYHLLKLSPGQFNELRAEGALLDLKALIEEFGPNIKSAVSEEIWATSTFDGKVYGLPQTNPSNNINSALFLRKDVFVDNNIEMPETLTEFKEALVTLKTAMGSNFVPFYASSHNIEPIRGAFGIVRDWVPQEDGSVKYWAETEEFNAYASYLRELVDAGLMQEGYLTTPGYGNEARAGLMNGTAGVTLDAWWSGNAIISGIAHSLEKTDAEIVENADDYLHFIPALKGDSGYPKSTVDKGEAKMDYSVTYFFSIPQYMSKYAEQVVKWLDKKLEPAIHKQLSIGVEGVHHKVIDGEYFPVLEKDEDGNVPFDLFAKGDYFLTGTNSEAYAKYWQARARKDPRQTFVWQSMNTDELKDEFGIYDKLGIAPGFSIFGANATKLQNLTTDFLVANISGEGTQMTQAQLIAKLKSDAKLDESTDEVNAWYKNN